MKRRKQKQKIQVAVTTNLVARHLKGDTQVGAVTEYNSTTRKKLFDDGHKKAKFRDAAFKDRETMDCPITGEKLHKKHPMAKRKYKSKYARHAAETDHIIPLERVHKMVSKNPFLNDSDIKKIANRKYNYEVASKSFNASKGAATNSDVVKGRKQTKVAPTAEGRKTLIRNERRAKLFIATDIAATTTFHVGQDFAVGAKESIEGAALPLALMVYNHICAVRRGDETANDVAKEMGKSLISIGSVGGINQVAKTALAQSDPSWLKAFVDSNAITQLWGIYLVMSDSVKAFWRGEIDTKEFSKQIITKSAGLLGGQVVGNVGTSIGSAICPGVGTVAGHMVGSAGAIYFQTCVQNLIDEIYGDGAFGAILASSEAVQASVQTTGDVVEEASANVEKTTYNIKEAQQISMRIKCRRDEFEKLKGE